MNKDKNDSLKLGAMIIGGIVFLPAALVIANWGLYWIYLTILPSG